MWLFFFFSFLIIRMFGVNLIDCCSCLPPSPASRSV